MTGADGLTASTVRRIRRAYAARVGYDPCGGPDGISPRLALQILREHRDAMRAPPPAL